MTNGEKPKVQARILGRDPKVMAVLPIPPSVNHYLQHFCKDAPRGETHTIGVRVKAKARQFKIDAGWLAKDAGIRMVDAPQDVRVEIDVYPGTRIVDLDNLNKLLLDALIGIAYEDDKQVAQLYSRRHPKGKYKPRIELTVSPID